MNKAQQIWKDKWKIINGFWNTIFGSKKIKTIAEQRMKICESNKCGFFDKGGVSEKAFIKGEDACSICGCNIQLLVNSMESKCSLQELGKEPLW